MTLFELFRIFFLVGLFTIGGGLVAIALMYEPIVGAGLITPQEFYNMVAVSESTPGPIGINMATYVGFKLFGAAGSIITTAGTVLPSLIVIVIIAKYFAAFHTRPLVRAAFFGLRPAAAGMIAVAAAKVYAITIVAPSSANFVAVPQAIFFCAATAALFAVKFHPLFIVLGGAVFGIIFL